MTRGVYAIVNTVTGDRYIGSSIPCCVKRIDRHVKDLRRNKHYNPLLQAAWREYGDGAFATLIIEEVEDGNFVRAREQAWLNRAKPAYNRSVDAFYCCPPDMGAVRSRTAKECWARPEYRERAIAARVGRSSNKGYKCTPEQVDNRRKAGFTSFLGKTHTAESREKISAAAKAGFVSGTRSRDTSKMLSAAAAEKRKKTNEAYIAEHGKSQWAGRVVHEPEKEAGRIRCFKRWNGDRWRERFIEKYGREPVE